MPSLRRYWQLPAQRRKALRQALLLTTLARLFVSRASLPTTRKFLPLAARGLKPQQVSPQFEIEIWAIQAASTMVPRSTCLVKALALHTLLARYGEETQLQVGVAKNDQGKFLAHAWVQQEDRILIGGEEANAYTSLLSLK